LSQSRVDKVKEAFEAFNNADQDAVLRLFSSEVEFFAPATASALGRSSTYSGHGGMRLYFEDVARVWSELTLVPETFRELGDHVVVAGAVRGRRLDGAAIEEQAAWAWKFRDGKIVWGRVYGDVADALGDVELNRLE
jgi:ketosteroid isomerase-like protein